MRNLLFVFIGLLLLTLSIQSCGDNIVETYNDYTNEEYATISKRLNLPSEVYNYSAQFEDEFFANHTNENVHLRKENHKATLGRVLFYDKKLSINESVSCASCHKQELAFADDVAFSEGFDSELTTRNSLPLGNTIGFETAYGGGSGRSLFSWDESNQDISSQSEAAIISEIEMGMDMGALVDRIRKDDIYPILFKKSYGNTSITQHRVLESIEEFVNSIVSSESKFDHQLMETNGNLFSDFSGFTKEENIGKNIYNLHCSSCHSMDHLFTSKAVANNGLDFFYEDKGIGARTNNPKDNGVFKIPFLRNIELTGPYMHDGRFETLREVIDHYDKGVLSHENLDQNLKSGTFPKQLNLSEEEKLALEAYLLTLTDHTLLADAKFSDPFK